MLSSRVLVTSDHFTPVQRQLQVKPSLGQLQPTHICFPVFILRGFPPLEQKAAIRTCRVKALFQGAFNSFNAIHPFKVCNSVVFPHSELRMHHHHQY